VLIKRSSFDLFEHSRYIALLYKLLSSESVDGTLLPERYRQVDTLQDTMSAAEERRKVLEEKKAKLAEMKRARDERMAAANQPQKPPSGAPVRAELVEVMRQVLIRTVCWLSDASGRSETRG
jgi:hypothetical protein